MATVHVINPGKKRRSKRNATKRSAKRTTRRATSNSSRKGATVGKKRRRRRRRAATNPAPTTRRRRRRRRSAKNPKPRRRARRNPGVSDFLGGLNLKQLGMETGAALGADLLMGFVVNRFGTPGPMLGKGGNSRMAGNAWSGRSYALAAGAVLGAGMMLGKQAGMIGEMARLARKEGLKSLLRRMFYTEIVAASPWLTTTFGSAMNVLDDRNGNRWIELADGTRVAMAGLSSSSVMGALAAASTYGGLSDADMYGDDVEEMAADDDGGHEVDDDDDEVEAAAMAEDVGPGLRSARAIDAGGAGAPGWGRRYYPPRPGDQMAATFRRWSPY